MNPSEAVEECLDEYLQEQREGEHDGQGCFTLSRAAALEKLANFQLPFEGAWAVKIVQAVVASGTRQAIRVTLGREETRFSWLGSSPWRTRDLEAAFLDPESAVDPGLEAMVIGLRAAALGESRDFRLRLAGDGEGVWLVWSDGAFESRPGEPEGANLLVVRNRAVETPLDWIARKLRISRGHRDVADALGSRCFTCPVPLWLDGRRLDGIPHCPGHGLERNQWPLSLRLLKVDGPRFRLPPADSLALAMKGRRPGLWAGMGLDGVTDELGSLVTSPETAALMLLTAHLDPSATSHNQTRPPDYLTPSPSYIFWVRHGAVVEVEPISKAAAGVSVALFLNAEGIETDLSSFAPRRGAEKSRRFNAGKAGVKKALKSFLVPTEQIKQSNRRRYRRGSHQAVAACAVGGGVLGAGAFGWAVLPFVGVGALTLLVAGHAEPHYERHLLEQLETEIPRLAELFGRGRS